MPQYEQVRVIEDPGSGEGYFGRYSVSVSEDGEIIVVGAPGRQAAYVFEGESVTTLAPSGAPEGFGVSVSVSPDGSTVAVGANDGLGGEGKVYVYGAPSWGLDATLTDPNGDSIFFGFAVAAANGNVLAVRGYRPDAGPGGTGNDTLDVFRGPSFGTHTSLDVDPTLSPVDISISSDGSVLAAQGNTYTTIYYGSNWGNTKVLSAPPDRDGDFSYSAAISGDGTAVLVAAQARYSYIFSGANWNTVTRLEQPIRYEGAYGQACALDDQGDIAVIAAHGADKVYAFEGPGDYETVVADDSVYLESFGLALALSADGTTLVVGGDADRVVVFTAEISSGDGWGLLL